MGETKRSPVTAAFVTLDPANPLVGVGHRLRARHPSFGDLQHADAGRSGPAGLRAARPGPDAGARRDLSRDSAGWRARPTAPRTCRSTGGSRPFRPRRRIRCSSCCTANVDRLWALWQWMNQRTDRRRSQHLHRTESRRPARGRHDVAVERRDHAASSELRSWKRTARVAADADARHQADGPQHDRLPRQQGRRCRSTGSASATTTSRSSSPRKGSKRDRWTPNEYRKKIEQSVAKAQARALEVMRSRSSIRSVSAAVVANKKTAGEDAGRGAWTPDARGRSGRRSGDRAATPGRSQGITGRASRRDEAAAAASRSSARSPPSGGPPSSRPCERPSASPSCEPAALEVLSLFKDRPDAGAAARRHSQARNRRSCPCTTRCGS